MKYLIITAALFCAICAVGQTIRKGNTFTRQRKTERDTLVTPYNFKAKGKTYPIVINKYTGACYIWRKSKTGKCYRQYMSKDIKETVCKELKIKSK